MINENGTETDDVQFNTGDDVLDIMNTLDKFSKIYKNSDGVSLLVGGSESYIFPEKFQGLADKFHFERYKSFHISDRSILNEVKKYISTDRMVIVVAWTKQDKIDVWLQREIVEPVESSGSKQESGGCFIATEVYGSNEALQVKILRKFRDEHLESSFLGKLFIQFYYAASPPIAKFISNIPILKSAVKGGLLDPFVRKLSSSFK